MPEFPAYSSTDVTQSDNTFVGSNAFNDGLTATAIGIGEVVPSAGNLHVEGALTVGAVNSFGLATLNNGLTVVGVTSLDVALSTLAAPTSGTIYQNTTGKNAFVFAPVTGTAAGTAQLALGPTSTPADFGAAETILLNSVKNLVFFLPIAWYWSITAAGTTLGTPTTITF